MFLLRKKKADFSTCWVSVSWVSPILFHFAWKLVSHYLISSSFYNIGKEKHLLIYILKLYLLSYRLIMSVIILSSYQGWQFYIHDFYIYFPVCSVHFHPVWLISFATCLKNLWREKNLTLSHQFLCWFFFNFFFFICSEFCHTLKWNSHGFTCVPHPDPPSHLPLYPLPLGLPSAPGPSACLMHPTWAGALIYIDLTFVTDSKIYNGANMYQRK